MNRRIFTLLAAGSLVLCLATMALGVRSYVKPFQASWMHERLGYAARTTISSERGVLGWRYDVLNDYFHIPHAKPTVLRLHFALIVIVLAIPSAFWISTRRRAIESGRLQSGLCPKCAYDLRASHDKCPECGLPIPADLPRKPIA